MLKKIITKLSLLLLLISAISCSKEEETNTKNNKTHEISHDFVQGSEDIPLLKDMKKIKDQSLGFDSASGSIMSSSYESVLNVKKVKKFYTKTLPQMGWVIIDDNKNSMKLKRDSERLEINFDSSNHKTIIRFFISYAL